MRMRRRSRQNNKKQHLKRLPKAIKSNLVFNWNNNYNFLKMISHSLARLTSSARKMDILKDEDDIDDGDGDNDNF